MNSMMERSNDQHQYIQEAVSSLEIPRFPIIDISLLSQNSDTKSLVIQEIGKACQKFGFFYIINHGISESVMEAALETNSRFFDLPVDMKRQLMSDDIQNPVRFGTVFKDDTTYGKFSRDFLKLYAHPLQVWIGSWPQNPSDYREKMGTYSTEVRRLGIQIFGAIMESLNLKETNYKHKFEQGMQMMAVNCYQAAPESRILTGIPPHTDHSIITILLQSSSGFQIKDPEDGVWQAVPLPEGSLQVLVGDHLQVLTNGLYKSLLHRAIPSSEKKRLSVVSLHSFAMDDVVEPAMEFVDEIHPKCYKGCSLRDFLNHLSSKVPIPFSQTLKIT